MPESVKTVLLKGGCVIAVALVLFMSGFYFGWQAKSNDVLEQQMAVIEQSQNSQHQQISNAVKQSDNVASEIQQELTTKDVIDYEHKIISEKDDSGVLDLPLPSNIIWLLRSASSGSTASSATR